MEKVYKNLGYYFILLIPLTFLGFYKTYFNQFPTFSETNILIHLHAIIATIWVLMLIIQPILIKLKRKNTHRNIGKLSYIIFPLLIISFVPQMLRLFNSDDPKLLFFPLSDCIALIIFYSLSIYYRHNVVKHMRFMIGAALVFLSPTLGRIGSFLIGLTDVLTQNLIYIIIYLILIGLILLDRKNKKKYQPYVFILCVWIIHQISFNVIF